MSKQIKVWRPAENPRLPYGVVINLKPDLTQEQIKAYFERHPKAKRVTVPSQRSLEHWVCDGVAKAVDGCKIEPDGTCEHGYPSWLLVLGIV